VRRGTSLRITGSRHETFRGNRPRPAP
jgi:hypothetical protein